MEKNTLALLLIVLCLSINFYEVLSYSRGKANKKTLKSEEAKEVEATGDKAEKKSEAEKNATSKETTVEEKEGNKTHAADKEKSKIRLLGIETSGQKEENVEENKVEANVKSQEEKEVQKEEGTVDTKEKKQEDASKSTSLNEAIETVFSKEKPQDADINDETQLLTNIPAPNYPAWPYPNQPPIPPKIYPIQEINLGDPKVPELGSWEEIKEILNKPLIFN